MTAAEPSEVGMRALTVQQPWAWAIVHGGKDVENRTQAWGYRGPLAIHAGARWSERGEQSPLVRAALDRVDPSIPGIPPDLWETAETLAKPERHAFGVILGVVDLVDVHTAMGSWSRDDVWQPTCCDSAWAETGYTEHGGLERRDIVHLVLENPQPLADPIPARGRLGLWTPDAELLDRIREQVTA